VDEHTPWVTMRRFNRPRSRVSRMRR
jgi:hypothetical protein